MAFDILGYYNDNKSFYGDTPLEDVAKDAYQREYKDKYPDYDMWKKVKGIDSIVQEDTQRRNPSFTDRLRGATSSVDPSANEPSWLKTIGSSLASVVPAAVKGAGGIAQALEETSAKSLASGTVRAAGMLIGKPLEYAGIPSVKESIDNTADLMDSSENPILNASVKSLTGSSVGKDLFQKGNALQEGWMPEGLERGSAKAQVYGGVSSFANNFGLILSALAASAVTKSPRPMAAILPVMAAQSGGTDYGEKRQAGMSESTSLGAGMLNAATEYVTEKIPLGILLDKKLSLGKRLMGEILTEIPGELAATTIEQGLIDTSTVNPNKTLGEFLQDLKDTAIQTAIATPLLAGSSHAMLKWAEKSENKLKSNEIQKSVAEGALPNMQDADLQSAIYVSKTLSGILPKDDGLKSSIATMEDEAKKRGVVIPVVEQEYIDNLEKGSELASKIYFGIKTGTVGGGAYSPENAIKDIQDGSRQGLFDNTDVERFKERYPQLRDALNGVIAENIISKVNAEVAPVIATREEDVPDFEDNSVMDAVSKLEDSFQKTNQEADNGTLQTETPIIDQQKLKYARKTLPYYPAQKPSEADIAILQEARAKGLLDTDEQKVLDKIVKPAEEIKPLPTAETSPIEAPNAPPEKIVEPGAMVEGNEKTGDIVTNEDGSMYELNTKGKKKHIRTKRWTNDYGKTWHEGYKIGDEFNLDTGGASVITIENSPEAKGLPEENTKFIVTSIMNGDGVVLEKVPKSSTVPAEKQTTSTLPAPLSQTDAATVGVKEVKSEESSPDFNEMVKEAQRWRGAAYKVDASLGDDKKARLAHSQMTTKADLDRYLITKYGIDEVTARNVSNELTAKNLKPNDTAKIEDFAGEPWAKVPAAPKPPEDSISGKVGAAGTVKEPWEQTKDDFIQQKKAVVDDKYPGELDEPYKLRVFTNTKTNAHKNIIEQALSEGKPVPPEVLKDYPDLVAKPAPKAEPAPEPAEIFIRKAERGDIGRIKQSMKAIPEKEGYEVVYKPDHKKEGKSIWYKKLKEKVINVDNRPKKATESKNLAQFIIAIGKVRLGSFSSKTGTAWDRAHGKRGKDQSREMGVIKAVASVNGKFSMDEAASMANAEGYRDSEGNPFTDVTLFNALAEGDARNMLRPDLEERKIDNEIEENVNEWAEQRAAETLAAEAAAAKQQLEEAGIDPGRIADSKEDIIADASETLGAERLTPEVLEANADEISNFFAEMSAQPAPEKQPAKLSSEEVKSKQANLEGTDSFNLVNPETDMSKHKTLSEQVTPKNEDLFVDHIADASKKVEAEAVEEDTAFKRDADLYTLKALEDRLKSINAQIGKEDNSETRGHRPSDHDKKTARIAKLNERRDIVSQRIRDAKAGKLVAPEPKPIRPAKPTPQERIDALVKKDQEYYDSAPSKGFIESNFSFENLSNKTKLARYLDGTENEYNGLVGWKWQSVLEKMGLPESIKWGETTRKEVAAFVKQQYEQAKPAEQQPEAKPDNNRPLFVVDAQHDIAKVTKWNGDKPTVIYAGTRGGIEAQTNKKYEYEIENYKEATSKDFDRAIRPGGSQTMIELRMWKDQFIKHTIENSEMGKRGAEQYKGWGKPAAKEPWQMTREEFLDAEELAKEERSQYVSPEGKVIASSRTTPAKQSQLKIGTWRRESTSWNKYGDTIEQLQEIDVSKINGSEDTGRDKADDVDRYADWIKEGKEPPPFRVAMLQNGTYKLGDGHRRLLALKKAGVKKVKAWVALSADTGLKDNNGNVIDTDLTHQLAIKQALSEGKPVPETVLKDYPELKGQEQNPIAQKLAKIKTKLSTITSRDEAAEIDKSISREIYDEIKKYNSSLAYNLMKKAEVGLPAAIALNKGVKTGKDSLYQMQVKELNEVLDRAIELIRKETGKGVGMYSVDTKSPAAYNKNKGESNERPTADNQSEGRGRDSLVSADAQRHAGKVDIQRSLISGNDKAPVRLREACQQGQGIVHAPEAYDNPDFIAVKEVADSYGVDLIPITDTSNNINGFIRDKNLFLNIRGAMSMMRTALHELSHFIGNAETQAKIDTNSEAYLTYKRQLSKAYYSSPFKALSDSHVLSEYAADLEAGVVEQYGVRLSEGLKKGETVAPIQQKGKPDGKFILGADELYMTAWHGSPYTFNKFSKDKIGTGEGAQSYGYGLYFAGKREVAEFYRKSLTKGTSAKLTFDGEEIAFPKYDNDLKLIFNENYTKQEIRDIIGTAILDAEHFNRNATATQLKEILNKFSTAKDIKLERGRLYQVELAPAEDEYLLWDKPLSEQSEKVKAALKSHRIPKALPFKGNTGRGLYHHVAAWIGQNDANGGVDGEKKASELLHSLGIRGIKYLDGTSRGRSEWTAKHPKGGENVFNDEKAARDFILKNPEYKLIKPTQNYNYVIFSDEDVSITEQYSLSPDKTAQWWDGRNIQAEIDALPIKYFQRTRDFMAEGYVPITRAEADDLYKNKLDEFIAWAQIRGPETTCLEGIFMRPLSYQGYERRRYDNGKWEENGEAKDLYKKYRDRFVSGRTGESIRETGRDAAVSEETQLQKVAESDSRYSVTKDKGTANIPAKTTPQAEAGKREAWEMTSDEWHSAWKAEYPDWNQGRLNDLDTADHVRRIRIEQAYQDGKTVNREFLKEAGITAASREPIAHAEDINSPEFKKWYGKSIFKDNNGNPVKVYHGGENKLTELADTSTRGDRLGVAYFTDDYSVAKTYGDTGTYPGAEEVREYIGDVTEVYIRIEKPLTDNTTAQSVFKTPKEAVDWIGDLMEDKGDSIRSMIKDKESKAGIWDAINSDKYSGPRAFLDAATESLSKNDLLRAIAAGKYHFKEFGKFLERRGFDGFVFKDAEAGGNTIIPFSKDQIKLPNPTRPPEVGGQNEQYSVADPLATHWETLENTKWDTMLYNLADKNIDAKDVVSAIRKFTSKEISETADAKLKETLYSGRLDARVKEFMQTEFEPVMIALARAKISRETFEEFLLMRHAIEANDYYRRNKGVQDGGSGVLDQEARDYFKTLDPGQNRQMQPIAEMIDKITHKSAQTLIEYGVESNNTIGAWFGSYEHYVPLSRDDDPVHGRIRQTGFSVSGSSSARRQGGSDKPALNILANIAEQREKYIKRGEKNIIAKALYSLAKENPNPEFWEIAKPQVVPKMNIDTGETVPVLDESYKKEDMVIMSRQLGPDGEIIERGIRFNEKNARAARMALALKNLDLDSIGAVLGAMAKVTRYMASINTQYNPVFGITNFFRDLGTMAFNLSTTPISGKQAQVLKGVGPAMMGISKALRGDLTSPQSQLFKEFQMYGGQTGYVDLYKTAEDRTKAIDKQLKLIGGKNPAMGLVSWAADALSNYNTSIENAVRLSAYEVGIANGMSKDKAAAMAKDLTVNFNRKGQWASQAGAMYAFFNASVQGTIRMYETFTGPKGKKIIAGGIIFGAVQALALAAAGFGDDEPPDFVRERNIIIPIGGKKYVTIPMPLGFNILPNIGRIPVEIVLTGGKDADKKIASMLGIILETFNPMGSSGLSIQTFMPTIADPFVALAENKDWTNKPIYRENFNSLDPAPGLSRAKDTSTMFGRALSSALNLATGGSKYTPGYFSPTPDQIDYLVGQATGGVGRELGKVSQTVQSMVTGGDLPSYKIPVVGRLYGNAEGSTHEGSRFYDNIKMLNAHEREIKGLQKDGQPVSEYIKDHPEARYFKMANQLESNIRKLKAKKDILKQRDANKDYVRSVDAQITAQMKRLNDVVSRAENL